MKNELLVKGPLLPSLMGALESEFTVHKLWLADDRRGLLADVGPRVRAMATSSRHGADAQLIEALPKLGIISCFGVGLDAIDLPAARERQVIVTNTPDVLTECVADAAFSLLLAVVRRVCEADRFVRAGRWRKENFPFSARVNGKRCGIVGLGRIGQAISVRAQAFGMEICYSGPRRKDEVLQRYYPDLACMARDVDFLVVSAPGGSATHHMIDAEVLSALGPSGYLVNVSRGSLVDEQALVLALRQGQIAGAGLDVYEDEPNVSEALFKMEQVVLMPHVASATHETRQAMGDMVLTNLHAFFSGKPLPNRVV